MTSANNHKKLFYIFFLAFGFYITLHLIHIGADTPPTLTYSPGTFCDEGYKTLDARNMVIFGKSHWSEADRYPGWAKGSPVTVIFNYVIFKLMGVSLSAARLGNLLFAIGSIILLFLIAKKLYDLQTAFISTFLCLFNEIHFFYGRIALFEYKMLFFLLLGLYCALFINNNRLFIIPAVTFWVASYYSKASAMVFFLTILFYLVLIFKDGLLVKWTFNWKVIVPAALLFVCAFGFLQYLFMFHREFYNSILFFGRHIRSPMGTVFHWFSQMFFTKNPILIFFTLFYIGSFLIKFDARKQDFKIDLFFITWFVLGTMMLSFMSHQPLRYYVYLVFPAFILASRCIVNFNTLWNDLLSQDHRFFKGILFSLVFYVLCAHLFFLRFKPVVYFEGWDFAAVKLFSIFSIALFSMLFIVFNLAARFKLLSKFLIASYKPKHVVALVLVMIAVQLIPIVRWATDPSYDLAALFERVEQLPPNSVIAGDWAPIMTVNSNHRVIYSYIPKSRSWDRNFTNLGEIRPDYFVFTSQISDHMLPIFKEYYPNVIATKPVFTLPYNGKLMSVYALHW